MRRTKVSDSSAGPGSMWLNSRSRLNAPIRTGFGRPFAASGGTRSILFIITVALAAGMSSVAIPPRPTAAHCSPRRFRSCQPIPEGLSTSLFAPPLLRWHRMPSHLEGRERKRGFGHPPHVPVRRGLAKSQPCFAYWCGMVVNPPLHQAHKRRPINNRPVGWQPAPQGSIPGDGFVLAHWRGL
jgi:hypothetical protein